MNLAKIQVSGVRAVAVDATREIPAGIVGATVELEYTGGIWAGLNKTVIFRGNTTKEVLTDETTVTVPAEVVAEPRGRLRVGVYGTDAANNLIMPTLWAELGVIADSAEPSEPADSALPIWAQLYAMIGNLGNLDTAAKSSLVAAVNELVGKSGSADPEEIKKIVEDYLAANPPKETDPTVPDWAKQPEKPKYTAKEVGAIGADQLPGAIDAALAQAKESGLFDGPQGPQGPQGIPGGDYVLTDTDRAEIAEMAANLVDIPTKVSQLTNDSGFQTAQEVNALINTALGVIENGSY